MSIGVVKERDYSIDNIRFILIFSVVVGHLLEICTPFAGSGSIYKFIYSFHMPVFIFMFGYNVRYSPKRIVYRWGVPYVVFQCAYIAFAKFVLNTNVALQFTTPYWLLWYLLACIYFQLVLPMFDVEEKYKQILALVCVFALSFLVGKESTIGYYMSLSRFFVFQPWFVLGYYCKKNDIFNKLTLSTKKRLLVLIGSLIVIGILAFLVRKIPGGLLYGSYPYVSCGGTMWMRALASVMVLFVILFLFIGVSPYWNKKQIIITGIGQNTLPIFLLHGFIVRMVPAYFPYLVSSPWRVMLFSCAILLCLGNKLFNKIVYYISFSWLEKVHTKAVKD